MTPLVNGLACKARGYTYLSYGAKKQPHVNQSKNKLHPLKLKVKYFRMLARYGF